MDNRNEVRDFLVSRRARITPEQAGLAAYGRNRRVSGLRREEAATLAGISVEYYTRLERGNASGVSADVLEAIVRALRLDEAERAHLYDPVRTANTTQAPRRQPPRERVRPMVQRIIDSLGDIPAYVRNGGWTWRRITIPRFERPAVPRSMLRAKAGQRAVPKGIFRNVGGQADPGSAQHAAARSEYLCAEASHWECALMPRVARRRHSGPWAWYCDE